MFLLLLRGNYLRIVQGFVLPILKELHQVILKKFLSFLNLFRQWLLMNNLLINTLALKNTRSLEELGEIPGLKRWFKDHFGREILAVQTGKQREISGELAVS